MKNIVQDIYIYMCVQKTFTFIHSFIIYLFNILRVGGCFRQISFCVALKIKN